MKYEQIWNAVDKLAKAKGLSPSGLAKLVGLDATTFNKSKRLRPDGNKRWPSLESINKILEISQLSFEEFYNLGQEDEVTVKCGETVVPFIKLSQLNKVNDFAGKNFKTEKWKKIIFPDAKDTLYAIEIDNDKYEPLYRNGSVIMVASNSDIRKGDRVAVYKENYTTDFYEFVRRTATTLLFKDLQGNANIEIATAKIKLIHRIVWAGQ